MTTLCGDYITQTVVYEGLTPRLLIWWGELLTSLTTLRVILSVIGVHVSPVPIDSALRQADSTPLSDMKVTVKIRNPTFEKHGINGTRGKQQETHVNHANVNIRPI